MENHGTEFESRWRLLRERVDAIKALWTQDEAEYHGEFVDFDPLWAYYGSWGAGFLTAFSAMRAWILKTKQTLLESEDEALLLEVRQAKNAEGGEKLPPRGDAEGG